MLHRAAERGMTAKVIDPGSQCPFWIRMERVSAAANAPTYGFFDQFVGRGLVGGNVNSLSAHGVEAGKLALEVLSGTEASRPQVAEVPTNKILFDWRQLQRWGITESKLPAGSEIRFRETSAWELYKLQILAITAAIFAQATLIAWLLLERQYRHRAERRARETFAELTHVNRMATAGELSAAIAHEIRQPALCQKRTFRGAFPCALTLVFTNLQTL